MGLYEYDDSRPLLSCRLLLFLLLLLLLLLAQHRSCQVCSPP